MRPNKCCCCDHKIGSLILLGVCLYIAVHSVLYSVKSDHGITALIDLFFIGFGFVIVLKEKSNFLLPTIIYLIAKSVLLAVGVLMFESENIKIEMSELNDEFDNIKFVDGKEIFRWTIIFLIVLHLSTALVLWWFKQQLEEKALANGQIPQYQTQFTNVQRFEQAQPTQYPHHSLVLPPYPQNQVLVPQYSQDPPPYPETKINLSK